MANERLEKTDSAFCIVHYELTKSLRRPGRKTLALLERVLAWLRPFESAQAKVASPTERQELLTLLDEHRLILSPYLDTDKVEFNLRRC